MSQSTQILTKLFSGKVRLDRRNGNPMIYARAWLKGKGEKGKDVTFRTGETELRPAREVAEHWYLEQLEKIKSGQQLHGPTFDATLVEKFIEHKRRIEGTSEGQCRNYMDKWNLLKPYLDGVKLVDIDAQWLVDFRDKRSKDKTRYGAAVKPTTLKKDLDFIRGVLRYAKEWAKSLDTLPEFACTRRTCVKRRLSFTS